jgi:hypothetical protein
VLRMMSRGYARTGLQLIAAPAFSSLSHADDADWSPRRDASQFAPRGGELIHFRRVRARRKFSFFGASFWCGARLFASRERMLSVFSLPCSTRFVL